ncbi:MAG: FAD-dependent oxidoreductase [Lentisphaerae bacterium]|nr:FAD-dependent oxidoreductase [Lentisphaerota bacterium]
MPEALHNGTDSSTRQYDVIVVGLGTAGAIAALAAARQGARVLALERNTYPGGTQSGGGIRGYYGGRPPYGLTAEVEELVSEYAAKHGLGINVEARKFVLERLLLTAGVEIVYAAVVYELLQEESCVRGVRWREASGCHSAIAGVVVDATAEGTLALLAGCKVESGRQSDGLYNTFTHTFLGRKGLDVHAFNFDAGRIDQYDPQSYSQTLLEAITVHLAEDYSAAECRQLAPADIVGIREGVHVITRTYSTLPDFFAGKLPDEEIIGYAHSNLDTHVNDMALESTAFQDWMLVASAWGTELWFPIYRGNLVPAGKNGLLLAGSHLRVDHDLGQAIRMNGHIGRIGEAAGILAALASRQKQPDLMAVPFAELAARMSEIPSPLAENLAVWGLEDEEIRQGLSSDQPGSAIWSAWRRDRRAQLREWHRSAESGSNLRCHAAFALALLAETCCLADLRRMALERDEYTPQNSRRYNHPRGYVAVYLLGRLADAQSIGLLADILRDQDIGHKFEYHTQALGALVNIGERHPSCREQIVKILRDIAEDPAWELRACLKATQVFVRADPVFRIYLATVLQRWDFPHKIGSVLPGLPLNAHERHLAHKAGLIA